jgi:hypothetical protein
MSKTVEEILVLKPEARPRIYAYSIADEPHMGLLKVGQTSRDVKQRVAEQLRTTAIKNFTIELSEPADRDDGASSQTTMCVVRSQKRASRTRSWSGCAVRSRT